MSVENGLSTQPILFVHVVDGKQQLTPMRSGDISHVLQAQRTFGKSMANGVFAAITGLIIVLNLLYCIELILDYTDIFTWDFLVYASLNTVEFLVFLIMLIASLQSHTRAKKYFLTTALLSFALTLLTWEAYIVVGGGPDPRLKNFLLLITGTVIAEFILLFSFFLRAIAVA